MEKVPEPYSWSVPKVQIYRDDLASLIRLFERHGEEVEVTVGTYRLSGADELDQVPLEVTHEMSISCHNPMYLSTSAVARGGFTQQRPAVPWGEASLRKSDSSYLL